MLRNFKGVMTPLLIPLDEEEELVKSELKTHINYLVKKGVHGFLSPSSTGEFANLSLNTRQNILQHTVLETNNRIPVISIIGECGTKPTLNNINFATQIGADAIMATPPYYYPLDQQSLVHHFNSLANESNLPLWLYHQPNDTKLSIDTKTLQSLSKNPNIVGIKISTTNLLYYHRVVRIFEQYDNFTVLMGEDHSYLPALSLGGNGVVSFLSNIIPETVIDLWNSVSKGKFALAKKSQSRIMDCFEAFFTLKNHNPISACKLILKERGVFSSERTSQPFPVLDNKDKELILKRASKLKLI